MQEKSMENNKVTVIGQIVSEFTFSHEVYGEGFYMTELSVNRLSDQADIIPLMVSERLMDIDQDFRGVKVMVTGQFRSYNRHEEKKNRLILSVFAREVELVDEIEESKSQQEEEPRQAHAYYVLSSCHWELSGLIQQSYQIK